jgi:hypothetical protein
VLCLGQLGLYHIANAQEDGILGPKSVVGEAMADAGKAAISNTGV